MKVLKDPDQVLQIMNRKLDELRKKCDEAEDKPETLEIVGEDASITSIAWYIRHTIEGHGCFDESDMADVYEYHAETKRSAHEYSNPRTTWYMKGLAKGAAWACVGLEDRMMEGQS